MAEFTAEVSWRVHPAAERKGTAAFVLIVILALSVLAAAWMRGAYWGLFAFAVLFLSLESFFLASRFSLGPEGVRAERAFSKSERPWSAFHSAWFDSLGVTLSPFGRRHWLETYRAVRVRYGRTSDAPSRAAVEAYILAHLDPAQVAVHGASRPADEGPARSA